MCSKKVLILRFGQEIMLTFAIQCVPKKRFLRRCVIFFTLKMLPIGGVDLNKNRHFLTQRSENARFTWKVRVFVGLREFSIEKGQFLTNGSKSP